MTTEACKKSGRKHTPITSKKMQGLMGAEYARRKAGKKGKMKGIATAELKSHLEESKGKELPEKAKQSKTKKSKTYDKGFFMSAFRKSKKGKG